MTIKSLEHEIELVKREASERISTLSEKLQAEYFKLFDDLGWVKGIEAKLYASKYWSTDEFDGYPQQWERFEELKTIPKIAREYFQEYVNDLLSISIDWKNDVISLNYGPAVIVDLSEGYAYDQDAKKEILKCKDFDSELEFKKAIEAYMESTGVFSGVFKTNKYGNIIPYDTQSKKESDYA
jgi:hypothetical protein